MNNASSFRTSPPPVTDFPLLTLPPAKTHELSNGVSVACLNSKLQPVVKVTLIYAGGLAECSDPYSLSLIGEALAEGSSKMSGEEFSDLLDYHGAWFNVKAQGHFTVVTLHALTENFCTVLDAVTDIINHPTFPEAEINNIIKRKTAAAKINSEKVAVIARRQINRMLFSDTHFMSVDLDEPEELALITPERLKKVWTEIFLNRQPRIYLSGYVDKILSDIEQEFSKASPKSLMPSNIFRLIRR